MKKKKPKSRQDAASVGRIQRGLQERAGWWDRAVERPLLWSIVAVLLCTWLVVPRVGRRLPDWKPGDVATFDVIIRQDLAIPDHAATQRLRQEAAAAVLPVYDLEPRLRQETIDGIRALFAVCRDDLKRGQLTVANLSSASDLSLDAGVTRILLSSQCGSGLEQALVDVVDQIYRQHVVDDWRAMERHGKAGVTVRNLATLAETQKTLDDLSTVIDFRSGLEPALRARLLEHDAVRRRWIKAAVHFLMANLTPDLVFNRAETAARRARAAKKVTPRLMILKRGQVLVRRGDAVTPAMSAALEEVNHARRKVMGYTTVTGYLLLVVLILLGWWKILARLDPGRERRYHLSIVFILLMIFTAVDRFGVSLANALALNSQSPLLSSPKVFLWALPHAAGPIVMFMMLGLEPAILFAVSEAVLVALMLGGSLPVVFYALAAGLAGVLAAQQFKERAVLTRVGMAVGVVNAVAVLVLELYRGWPDPLGVVALSLGMAFVGGPVAAGIATFLLPFFEKIFGVTTDIRLLELSNQNLPLLRRLSLEAPGTFQHSLSVGNLAEAGADAIGANGLMLRVCSYYHDVGKLVKPEYFVENQHGSNPHDHLTPSMSALVIMSHVKEGLEIARKEKLPLPIRQAIATHHGTKLIRYFYSRAQQQAEEQHRDPGEIRESDYRYPGPKPHTKELGILLLADAVEAAARTLDNPMPGKIRNMIERIVTDALEDGQLDQSELTFKELEKVGSAFLWVLTNMFHSRIDYPGFDFNGRKKKSESGSHRLATPSPGANGSAAPSSRS
ncbi:MAG: HDIG domain-containing protein [Acidobacteria bacterium]|nr:HDIG domain-containing protein [Acidobacteriota bacterium]